MAYGDHTRLFLENLDLLKPFAVHGPIAAWRSVGAPLGINKRRFVLLFRLYVNPDVSRRRPAHLMLPVSKPVSVDTSSMAGERQPKLAPALLSSGLAGPADVLSPHSVFESGLVTGCAVDGDDAVRPSQAVGFDQRSEPDGDAPGFVSIFGRSVEPKTGGFRRRRDRQRFKNTSEEPS